MILHTTHWSRDGQLHRGTVEGCPECGDRQRDASTDANAPPPPLGDEHDEHGERC
jgi:hypothetical protein